MINIALFGPPGCGKGTQSKMLLDKYKLTYISTGDMLRSEIANNTDLGKQAKNIIEKGGLVSDDIIVQIIEDKIKKNSDCNGFLFDGFPRTAPQAYILEGLMMRMNTSLSCMISLTVPKDELVNRMLERAKRENRSDDKIEVIQYRMQEYENKTLPVANFYKELNKYNEVDGVGSLDVVFDRIAAIINKSLENVWQNYVFFGPPGAGKGTHARKLAEKFNLAYISTGSLLREEIQNDSEIGKIAKPYVDRGDIVPDEIAIKIMEKEIDKHLGIRGIIFKGFPLSIAQSYIFDGMLRKKGAMITHVYDFTTTTLHSVKRLTARSKSPEARNYDMDIDVLLHRLDVFDQRTAMLKDYYKKKNLLETIDADREDDEVFEDLCNRIEKSIKILR